MASQKQYLAVWPSGRYIRWRGISMREYEKYSRRLSLETEMSVYCDLYTLVVTEGPSIEQVTAGIVEFLGNTLLRNNAFGGDPALLEGALNAQREVLKNDYLEACKAVLAGLFRYTFEEIESWDEQTFFERLAKAELISGEDLSPKLAEPEGNPQRPAKRPKKPLTPTQEKALERTISARHAS